MNLTYEQLQENPDLAFDFINFFFKFSLHFYQKAFIKLCLTQRRIAGKWCRQAGKSQIVAIYILLRVILERTAVNVVSPTQNQSNEMYLKIREIINDNPDLAALVKKDTQKEMTFNNGSRIISLPCGTEGRTIRGYTCDVLVIEEAGIMSDNIVNTVLIPMLASKGMKGQIIKIGTPLVRNHFYRSCFEDNNYEVLNVHWTDCVKAGQYTIEFVEEQKSQLTDIEFRTEYNAEFIDSIAMFFPTELLHEVMLNYTMMRVL